MGGEGPQRSAVEAGREGGIASHLRRSSVWIPCGSRVSVSDPVLGGGAGCQGTVSINLARRFMTPPL